MSELSTEQLRFIREFRSYLDTLDWHRWAGRGEAHAIHRDNDGGHEFLRRLGQDGWLGVDWPTDFGGQGRSAVEGWLVREELAYRHLPTGGLGLSSIGPALIEAGSEYQRRRYLPGMLSGEIDIVVGYTEPDAGSDLASLKTKAVRYGDKFVINGQKLYITGAHCATHIWLAVRTGAADSGRRGLSVLIVPMDAPGVAVIPQPTQAGGQTNEVFFENVEVSAQEMVGGEGDGWPVIRLALSRERTFHFSGLAGEFRRLVDYVTASPALRDDVGVGRTLASLRADLELARLLSMDAASQSGEGRMASSMTKVWVSELRQRLASVALELLGDKGQLTNEHADAPMGGRFGELYLFVPMMKIGGGTNEVQRSIITQEFLNDETWSKDAALTSGQRVR